MRYISTRFVHLLLLLLLLPLPSRCGPPLPFLVPRVPFDCRRFHPAHCCSSRVRQSCPQLCLSNAASPCIAPFTQPFPALPSQLSQFGGISPSTDRGGTSPAQTLPPFGVPFGPLIPPPIVPPAGQGPQQRRFSTEGEIRSGQQWTRPAETGQNAGNFFQQRPAPPPPAPHPTVQPPLPYSPSLGLILPPPDTPEAKGTPTPIDELDGEEGTEEEGHGHTHLGPPAPSPQTEVRAAEEEETADGHHFATLVPQQPDFRPSIDEPVENGEETVVKSAGGAVDGTASPRNTNARKQKGALRPPDLMKELEEFGGEEQPNNAPGEEGWWSPIKLSIATASGDQQSQEGHPSSPFVPQHRTTVSELNSTASPHLWSVRIQPSRAASANGESAAAAEEPMERDLPLAEVTKGPPSINDGLFGKDINVIVDRVFNEELIAQIAAITGRKGAGDKNKHFPRPDPLPQHGTSTAGILSATLTSTGPAFSFSSSSSSAPPPPEQCGVAPDFRPCVPLEQANGRLLACCQQKQMPAGCLPLCRYDTTQAQVKQAFEKGQCGLLNVAPFLQCASQGNDNVQCCRHRDIAKRSGAQCEVFCNPAGGLGLLGIQHLVCQSALQSMLECHHAGLR